KGDDPVSRSRRQFIKYGLDAFLAQPSKPGVAEVNAAGVELRRLARCNQDGAEQGGPVRVHRLAADLRQTMGDDVEVDWLAKPAERARDEGRDEEIGIERFVASALLLHDLAQRFDFGKAAAIEHVGGREACLTQLVNQVLVLVGRG